MMLEGLRGYLQLASGLTDVTRARARAAARALVAQGEAVVPSHVLAQVSALTDELLATSKANRNLLVGMIRGEVERTVSRLGLVSTQELDATGRRVELLESKVADLEAGRRTRATKRSSGTTTKAAKKSATATKTAAEKAGS